MADSPGRGPISQKSSSAPSEGELPRARRHWGRRKGPSLSARQAQLLETLLPKLSLHLTAGCDPRTYFQHAVDDVWLEVGFGGGEHLFWQAQTHPDVGIIGAEPYVSGMAKLLSKIADANIGNVVLYAEDAHDIVDALPDASVSRVFLLFPDPWPKTRHHKRRFIQVEMLDRLARVLKDGGEFRFATDDAGYLSFALERLIAHPQFSWTARSAPDWQSRPADWPETRYEAKAIREGRACTYLRFERTAR